MTQLDKSLKFLSMREIIERASEQCRREHIELNDNCRFCQYDKAIFEYIRRNSNG